MYYIMRGLKKTLYYVLNVLALRRHSVRSDELVVHTNNTGLNLKANSTSFSNEIQQFTSACKYGLIFDSFKSYFEVLNIFFCRFG